MKKALNKVIAGLSLMALLLSTTKADSAEYNAVDTGGYAYQDSYTTSYMGPALALGTIAAVAIIAVAVQNSSNSHSH